MGPRSTQEYSSFAVVAESEVDGQCFILERCCHWGIPIELDSSGHCEDPLAEQDPLV
jgi:hypothetical protein